MEESSHARGDVGAWQTDPNGNITSFTIETIWYDGRYRDVFLDLRPDGTVRWRFGHV